MLLRRLLLLSINCKPSFSSAARLLFSSTCSNTNTNTNTNNDNNDDKNQDVFVRSHRTEITQRLWEARYKSAKEGTQAPMHIIEKSPEESKQVVQLQFSKNAALREQYISIYGGVRFGKILEDLDALACTVATIHADDQNPETRPLTIVTAACDRIDIRKLMSIDHDITMTGLVTFVGRSSMEVAVTLTQMGVVVLSASFTLVAKCGGTAAEINRLLVDSPEGRQRYERGFAQKESKREAAKRCLTKIPPTTEEVSLVHKFFTDRESSNNVSKNGSNNGSNKRVVTPSSTALQSVILCHPQDRNMNNSIFGGYLMRLSFDIGWAAAHVLVGKRPLFRAVDEIAFLQPVKIGDMIQCDARVVYTQKGPIPAAQVCVETHVLNPVTGERPICLKSHYTFIFDDSTPVAEINPVTYEEAMDFLDGRRRLNRCLAEELKLTK